MDLSTDAMSTFVTKVGSGLDIIGVIAIGVGVLWAAGRQLLVREQPGVDRYKLFRRHVGRSILLGLELLVAGDIIRTVAVNPTMNSLVFLAGIVVIRTFLSFSMELEINGRWPWSQAPPDSTEG